MRKFCLILLVACVALTGVVVADSDHTDPVVTKKTRRMPSYPPAALAAGYQGTVTVAALVNADGSLGAAQVIDETRPGLGFDDAVIDAMRGWKFHPATVDGEAVDSVGAFVFRFESQGRISPTSRVGSDFLLSQTFPQIGIGTGAAKIGGVDRTAEFENTVLSLQKQFVTPSKPNVGPGQMYDRTKVLPKQVRTVRRTPRGKAGYAGGR